jgi:hypothetical protein
MYFIDIPVPPPTSYLLPSNIHCIDISSKHHCHFPFYVYHRHISNHQCLSPPPTSDISAITSASPPPPTSYNQNIHSIDISSRTSIQNICSSFAAITNPFSTAIITNTTASLRQQSIRQQILPQREQQQQNYYEKLTQRKTTTTKNYHNEYHNKYLHLINYKKLHV